jgi:hypothetical protein
MNGGETFLLGRALHPLTTTVHIFIIVQAGISMVHTLLVLGVHVLQNDFLGHSVRVKRGSIPRRENFLQKGQFFRRVEIVLRELDIEMNVEIAHIVMAVRRHTLSGDLLDSAFRALARGAWELLEGIRLTRANYLAR